MTPATHNFTIVRGTTQPFKVRITIEDVLNPPDRIPIPMTAAILSIQTGSVVLTKSTADVDSGIEVVDDVIIWTPTPAESRSLATGENKNKYELEIRDGSTQMVYLTGNITAIGGINTDD